MKNMLRYFLPAFMSLALILSIAGECSGGGLDILSKGDSGTSEIPSGDIVTSGDASSPITPPEEKNEPPADTTNDDGGDVKIIPTSTNNEPDNTMNSSELNDDMINNEYDSSLENDSKISINDVYINNESSEYTLDQIKDKIDVNYENLGYWLEKLNLSNLGEDLKIRLFELAKKASFMYVIKLKIMELLQDNSLSRDEKQAMFLRYIKATCLNERDVSSEEISLNVEKQLGNIDIGEKAIFDIAKMEENVGVDRVQLVAKKDLANVKVSIIKLKQKPEDIPLKIRKNESVYQYLDIKLTDEGEYLSENDIEILNFTFNVNVSWIVEKNIDKNTIILIRYHDGEWQNLTTRLLCENETHILYIAESEGCSTFAVIGSTLVEISEPYISESPDIPWTIIIAITSSTTILLGFILVKARYIYIGEEYNNKKVKKR